MKFHIGDFILTKKSSNPALIVRIDDNSCLLISISEYDGDYTWDYEQNVELAKLNSEEKLSIVANFCPWFYEEHKLLYQELIIENIR
jgi:hypothetical protein